MAIELDPNITEALKSDVAEGGIGTVARMGMRPAATKASEKLWGYWGLGIAYLIDAYINYSEFKQDEKRILAFYAPEVAAKLGKDPRKVTIKDLKLAAKDNPAIATAFKRNRNNRDLGFVTSAIGATVSFFATEALLPPLLTAMGHFGALLSGAALFTPLGLTLFAITATISFVFLVASDKGANFIGKRLIGLSEPSVNDADRKPALQRKMSVPSQIEYLETLQARRTPISQEQVLTTFIAADPGLAEHIKASYGKPFAKLSGDMRIEVIKELGPNYNLDAIAGDLNSHRVRAQELAFTVYGQESGIPKPAAPRASAPANMVEDSAPSFTHRTRILDERQKSAQQSPILS